MFCSEVSSLGGSFGSGNRPPLRALDLNAVGSLNELNKSNKQREEAMGTSSKIFIREGQKPRARRTVKRKTVAPVTKDKMLQRKLDRKNIHAVLTTVCCKRNCNEHFSANQISNTRKELLSQPLERQNAVIMDKLKKYGSCKEDSEGQETFNFVYKLAGGFFFTGRTS